MTDEIAELIERRDRLGKILSNTKYSDFEKNQCKVAKTAEAFEEQRN